MSVKQSLVPDGFSPIICAASTGSQIEVWLVTGILQGYWDVIYSAGRFLCPDVL